MLTNDDSSSETRLDQVLADYLRAVHQGHARSRSQLIEAHPDLAEPLRSFFADQDAFQVLVAPLSSQLLRYAGIPMGGTDRARYHHREPLLGRFLVAVKRQVRWAHQQANALVLALAAALLFSLGIISWLWSRTETHLATRKQAEEKLTQAWQLRLQAEQNLRAAQQERLQAEDHLRQVHRAVHIFLNWLLDQLETFPDQQPLRRRLGEAAVAYCRRSLDQGGSTLELLLFLADTKSRLAGMYRANGDNARACQAYQEAFAIYRQFFADRSAQLGLLPMLVTALRNQFL